MRKLVSQAATANGTQPSFTNPSYYSSDAVTTIRTGYLQPGTVRYATLAGHCDIFHGLALLIGVPLGAIAGYSNRLIDEIIMRITGIFCGFPALLLAITVAAFLGPSLPNAMLAIGISWWPLYTRLIYGQVISLRERQFVRAAKVIGTHPVKIIFGHILPNCIAPLIVQASLDMGSVILVVSALSFLGLGAQPPTPDWGLMISTSRNPFLESWWYSVFPGLAIFVTVLTFNLLGDGFREVLDPKTRNR